MYPYVYLYIHILYIIYTPIYRALNTMQGYIQMLLDQYDYLHFKNIILLDVTNVLVTHHLASIRAQQHSSLLSTGCLPSSLGDKLHPQPLPSTVRGSHCILLAKINTRA